MDAIFHEKQEGGLCAQHCLNSLLQGPYYTAFDLAEFAKQLDEEERDHMREGDVNSLEFLKFMEQPSSNMDDSGFFSIQVLYKALQVWGLELMPFSSPNAASARQQPVKENAFICNLQQHWFTIRKLGQQWFNLNSTQNGPVLISETYLNLFLAQLEEEGYSIFVVNGSLPTCEADRILMAHPVSQVVLDTKQNAISKATQSDKQCPEPAMAADPKEVREKRMQYFSRMRMSENSKEGLASENYTNSNIPECSDQGKSKMEESSKKCVRSDQKTDGNQTQKVSSEMDANVEETEEELLKAALALSKLQQ